MTTFLASQPANTATSAYNIKLTGATAPPWNNSGLAQTAFSGKYVNLDLSGNTFTNIYNNTFYGCTGLTSITIPASVTSIGSSEFSGCTSLVSVTFAGPIASTDFNENAFLGMGDLRIKFYAGGSANGTPGTYTTTAPVGSSSVWTKR